MINLGKIAFSMVNHERGLKVQKFIDKSRVVISAYRIKVEKIRTVIVKLISSINQLVKSELTLFSHSSNHKIRSCHRFNPTAAASGKIKPRKKRNGVIFNWATQEPTN